MSRYDANNMTLKEYMEENSQSNDFVTVVNI